MPKKREKRVKKMGVQNVEKNVNNLISFIGRKAPNAVVGYSQAELDHIRKNKISLKDYYNIITGDFINWSRRPYDFSGSSKTVYESTTDTDGSESRFGLIEALGHSAFIAINTSRTSINENFEGYCHCMLYYKSK